MSAVGAAASGSAAVAGPGNERKDIDFVSNLRVDYGGAEMSVMDAMALMFVERSEVFTSLTADKMKQSQENLKGLKELREWLTQARKLKTQSQSGDGEMPAEMMKWLDDNGIARSSEGSFYHKALSDVGFYRDFRDTYWGLDTAGQVGTLTRMKGELEAKGYEVSDSFTNRTKALVGESTDQVSAWAMSQIKKDGVAITNDTVAYNSDQWDVTVQALNTKITQKTDSNQLDFLQLKSNVNKLDEALSAANKMFEKSYDSVKNILRS